MRITKLVNYIFVIKKKRKILGGKIRRPFLGTFYGFSFKSKIFTMKRQMMKEKIRSDRQRSLRNIQTF